VCVCVCVCVCVSVCVCVCERERERDTVKRNVHALADQIKICHTHCIYIEEDPGC